MTRLKTAGQKLNSQHRERPAQIGRRDGGMSEVCGRKMELMDHLMYLGIWKKKERYTFKHLANYKRRSTEIQQVTNEDNY